MNAGCPTSLPQASSMGWHVCSNLGVMNDVTLWRLCRLFAYMCGMFSVVIVLGNSVDALQHCNGTDVVLHCDPCYFASRKYQVAQGTKRISTYGGFKTFAVFRMQSVFFWEFSLLLDPSYRILTKDPTESTERKTTNLIKKSTLPVRAVQKTQSNRFKTS